MPAKEKGTCSIFLKKTDSYSVNISPTFNGLKTYPTALGGGLTILSILVLMFWLVFQLINVFAFTHPTISVSRQNIDPKNTQQSPLWNITAS